MSVHWKTKSWKIQLLAILFYFNLSKQITNARNNFSASGQILNSTFW